MSGSSGEIENQKSKIKNPLRLGILGSGKGSNFLAIQEDIAAHRLHATVQVVISDQAEAGILARARTYGLPAIALPTSRFKTKLEPEIEESLVATLREHQVDWVVLAGYMRVVKAPLLQAYPDRILNIHPSLLPKFKGLAAWRQALEAGEKEAGCTVHLVNAEIDGGRILAQARVPVLPDDTDESLHARIQVEEHRLYPEVLHRITQGEWADLILQVN
jgi:phosphoribosylglycinamide formyltransferase 1